MMLGWVRAVLIAACERKRRGEKHREVNAPFVSKLGPQALTSMTAIFSRFSAPLIAAGKMICFTATSAPLQSAK